MTRPVQLALFGAQYVHLGRWSRAAGLLTCVMCGVSLAMSALWSDCDCCRGLVEPVPPWMVLGTAGEPETLETLEAA